MIRCVSPKMGGNTKCICLIFILSVFKYTKPVSIIGIFDPKNPNAPLLRLPNWKKHQDIRSEGIFERFLRNLLDLLLNDFPDRKLTKYCRVLSNHLEKMEYKHTYKFARHLKKLAKMHRDGVKSEIEMYRQELDRKLPRTQEFLEAMDTVFTLRENQFFNDYIYELRNYGNEDIPFIDDETHKLLNDVIVGKILELSAKEQEDLFKKFRKAWKEYQ